MPHDTARDAPAGKSDDADARTHRRPGRDDVDIVGSGPNGLSAAISLARQGFSVRVLEASDTPGGGSRTMPLANQGPHADLLSDPCAAVHPLALASPFLRSLNLERHGLTFLHSPVALGHPLPSLGRSVALRRDLNSVDAGSFGSESEAAAWRRIMAAASRNTDDVAALLLGDGRSPTSGAELVLAGGTGQRMRSVLRGARGFASALSRSYAEIALHPDSAVSAVLAGLAVHAIAPPARPVSMASGVLLGATLHGRGWPILEGGSGALVAAMIAELEAHRGEVECGRRIDSLDQLDGRAVVLAVGALEARRILGASAGLRARLLKPSPGGAAARVDFVLSGDVPWADERLAQAGTVHLTGDFRHADSAENAVRAGKVPDSPAILASQPWTADPARISPDGSRVLWSYAHVPNGSDVAVTERVTRVIEASAPGFRDVVDTTVERGPAELERYNASYPGGDIASIAADVPGMTFRFARSADPYAGGARGVWMASASTPPGPGVHGMAGAHAARRVAAYLRSGHSPRG